jgi:hypothetical protein
MIEGHKYDDILRWLDGEQNKKAKERIRSWRASD